ncbi:hypothetical protein KBY58_06925 [Cyanobium sp. HWJ4-Hawea]|uniref:hypothetical protein n=1 Tax=Cyanobium sp. HWJ4-Hawea TaxID=2823713 RepID=UPI0020CD608C|nr:hypothetical protein [Cyanobium sp. HWJ4-Hawea]MCP9809163.1 hypothetical protein [Cyanobium sp. HWJ4-Hawea]
MTRSPLPRNKKRTARAGKGERRVFNQRRPNPPWRRAGSGLLLAAVGGGLVAALMQLPQRFDTLLLLSKALANVIRGIQLFGLGILEVAAVVLLVAVAVGALVLVVAGIVRVVRAFLPPRK